MTSSSQERRICLLALNYPLQLMQIRTISNIGRAIIKKLAVKFEENEILRVDDYDLSVCYRDLWKTKSEKRNAIRKGIISNDGAWKTA